VVLNGLRDQALRAIAAPGSDDTVGYWEWSAPPACALDDRDGWAQANPALGHLISEQTLDARTRSDPPPIVRTEMLCQWVDTLDSPWPPDAWKDCLDVQLQIATDRPTWLAVDQTPDRRRADLIAVQETDDGHLLAVMVASWDADGAVDELKVAGDVAGIARKLDTRVVAFDRYTGSAIAARLATAGIPVGDVSGPGFVQACDELLSAMVSGRLRHTGQQLLTDHISACAKRPAADGGWRIVRRQSSGPVSGAVALAMAIHHAVQPQAVAEIIVG
jgi:phage terminase large subunit-like protein